MLELNKRIRHADAVLMVAPEYDYSISGVLKNALDWRLEDGSQLHELTKQLIEELLKNLVD